MAMTETIQKLYVDGEWYETGETADVTSPYDGSVVGRVAYGGADDARRAIDAAEKAMRARCPRTGAPRSSTASPGCCASAATSSPAPSPRRPASRSRRPASRSTGRCRRSPSRRWRRAG